MDPIHVKCAIQIFQHGRIIPSCWEGSWMTSGWHALAFNPLYVFPVSGKKGFFLPISASSDWSLCKYRDLASCHTQHIPEASSSVQYPFWVSWNFIYTALRFIFPLCPIMLSLLPHRGWPLEHWLIWIYHKVMFISSMLPGETDSQWWLRKDTKRRCCSSITICRLVIRTPSLCGQVWTVLAPSMCLQCIC